MIRKEELYFESRDNVSKIHAVKWIPEIEKPICILQIIHGMAEYAERYEDFALSMAQKGLLVVAEDHMGHGKSISEGGVKGYLCKRDAATVIVRDCHRLKKMMQEKYPGVPYIILGHSMGSFIIRNYLCRYGTGIQGAVIGGTGMPAWGLLELGRGLTAILDWCGGSKKPSRLLDRMTFGAYNKRIENRRTAMDWLSRDEKIVDAYIADPLCGFTFTVNGFRAMFELIHRLYKKENLEKMPKELPILFVAGEEDPLGNYGKDVEAVYQSFLDMGMRNVKRKLYQGDRHEIFNEIDKQQVYEDVYLWILSVIEER